MDINSLLKGRKCECGMVHSCDIKEIIIKPGAINEIGRLTENYKNILLTADNNTYGVCGDKVKELLRDKIEAIHIFETEGLLVPDEKAVSVLSSFITDKTDLIIGIGSGVIQDLCKYVSFLNKLPYHIIATAPSMDGYASKGAAMIAGNMKVTYTTHVPEVIIGDTDILKNAPMDMIKSGYGDILGKFSCLNDWELSAVVNGEPVCRYVYDLTYEMLSNVKDLGQKLLERDSEAIGLLTEALAGVGIAMAYMGNSRPASGSEHHLSHFFEIVGLVKNEPYFMHGTDVVFASVYTQKLRENLLKLEKPECVRPFLRDEWESKIREVYADAAEGVIALQNKLGWYEQDKTDIYKDKWNEIKEVLKKAPSSDEMVQYLESVDLDIAEFEKLYGSDKINDAVLYAKDLKDRYTVLWLYWNCGI